MKRIGFVGGGTGGHFYPLIAVIEQFESVSDTELYYFGPDPYDSSLLKQHSVKYISCPAGKWRRYFSWRNFVDIFKSLIGFFVALWKLYVIYPDVIFSKGSFTSVPILMAARILRIPVVIHESDAVPGLANKFSKGFAKYIGVAYDDAARFFPKEKTALVGIPLRKEILKINEEPLQKLGLNHDKPLIYVTGGSMGSERLNNSILASLEQLLPDYQIFHQTGQSQIAFVKEAAKRLLGESPLLKNYYPEGVVGASTMSLLLDASSVVVTRAGSTALFEIAAHGRPAIVIPIPESISHDQRTNAYTYASSGAALVIEEHNLTPHLLEQEIHSIVSEEERYQKMSAAALSMAMPHAAEKIANILNRIAEEHVS